MNTQVHFASAADHPICPCGGSSKRFGFRADGRQRHFCLSCKRTFGEKTPRHRGNHITLAAKIFSLEQAYREGKSTRQAALVAGVAKQTAMILFQKFRLSIGPAYCKCGNVSGHKGWCAFLFSQSPARQAWMKTVVRRQMRPRPMSLVGGVWRPEFTLETQVRCSFKGCPFPAVMEKRDVNAWEPVCYEHKKFMDQENGTGIEYGILGAMLEQINTARTQSSSWSSGYRHTLDFTEIHDSESGTAKLSVGYRR